MPNRNGCAGASIAVGATGRHSGPPPRAVVGGGVDPTGVAVVSGAGDALAVGFADALAGAVAGAPVAGDVAFAIGDAEADATPVIVGEATGAPPLGRTLGLAETAITGPADVGADVAGSEPIPLGPPPQPAINGAIKASATKAERQTREPSDTILPSTELAMKSKRRLSNGSDGRPYEGISYRREFAFGRAGIEIVQDVSIDATKYATKVDLSENASVASRKTLAALKLTLRRAGSALAVPPISFAANP